MCKKQISIRFCGGCNPVIDRGRIAETVQNMLSAMGYTVYYNRMDVDFVIYISGCSANCAQRYNPTDASNVIVAGATIDALGVDERELAVEIVSRVRDCF